MPDNLSQFGAHQKALELFDLLVADLCPLRADPALHRLISLQYASADSIASTIEEGDSRGSRREYTQFPIIARGSAQATKGRYLRFKHWLPTAVLDARARLCDEIIGLLTATI